MLVDHFTGFIIEQVQVTVVTARPATHWDAAQADHYTDELQATCEAVAVGNSDTALHVIRILHGRQDGSRLR